MQSYLNPAKFKFDPYFDSGVLDEEEIVSHGSDLLDHVQMLEAKATLARVRTDSSHSSSESSVETGHTVKHI